MDKLRKIEELARSLDVPIRIEGRDSTVLSVYLGEALWASVGDPERVLEETETYLRGIGLGLWLAAIKVEQNTTLTAAQAVAAVWGGNYMEF